MSKVITIEWKDCPERSPNTSVRLIDQSLLPHEEVYVECTDYHQVADAIRTMKIRGAPAIGVAAAFGIALAAQASEATTSNELIEDLLVASSELASTRPTAVNLAWALNRMLTIAREKTSNPNVDALKSVLVKEAIRICEEDIEINRQIGLNGARLLQKEGSNKTHEGLHVLTHCNAGALATAGYGTALGVIRSVFESGASIHVLVDETRPWLQGSRLTAWELMQDKIPATLIADNMAAQFMRAGEVDAVVVGADRIASNGDVANKIGTYNVAVLARHHGIPFYVAAPVSTIDFSIPSGDEIPIEQRDPKELTTLFGRPIAPVGMSAANPVFDVTPHDLVTAIITEQGILTPPFEKSIGSLKPST